MNIDHLAKLIRLGFLEARCGVLLVAHHKPGSSGASIAKDLDIGLPTVTMSRRALEREGLLEDAPSARDGRVTLVNVTERGTNESRTILKLLRGVSKK